MEKTELKTSATKIFDSQAVMLPEDQRPPKKMSERFTDLESEFSKESDESEGMMKKEEVLSSKPQTPEDNKLFDITSADVFSLAMNGRIKQLKMALEMGIDPNSKDRNGNSLIILGA